MVLITDNQVTRTYPAEGRTTYKIDHTFDVARITGETPALLAAQSYAATHHIRYNAVRALLHEESIDKPFYWKITLLRGESLRGAVYVRAVDGAFSEFVPAPTSESSGNGFTKDVKRTFLGVGGDLEEFFTRQPDRRSIAGPYLGSAGAPAGLPVIAEPADGQPLRRSAQVFLTIDFLCSECASSVPLDSLT